MIRKLDEHDRERALKFVGDRPAENLFLIGDIEAYGMSGDAIDLWGDIDTQGELSSLLLRYQDNFIPYARDPELLDGAAWGDVIGQSGKLKHLSGLHRLMARITPHIGMPAVSEKLCIYARRDLDLPLDKAQTHENVSMLFPEEADKVIALRRSIFPHYSETAQMLQMNMDKGVSRTYYIEQDNEPVSSVSTTAETRSAAMIVGVCTKKGYEHRGFATSCLLKTIRALQAERKQACLFYDNPAAGRIYEKLGFKPIDQWQMVDY